MKWQEIKQLQEYPAGAAGMFVGALSDGLQMSWEELVEVVAALDGQLILRRDERLCNAPCEVEACTQRGQCREAEKVAQDLRDNIDKAKRAHEYHQRRAWQLELKMSQVAA